MKMGQGQIAYFQPLTFLKLPFYLLNKLIFQFATFEAKKFENIQMVNNKKKKGMCLI
jgi:hypothetical protein